MIPGSRGPFVLVPSRGLLEPSEDTEPVAAAVDSADIRGLGTTVQVSGSVQYEKWNYPVLDPSVRSNVTTSIEVSFWPRNWGLQNH